MNGHDQLELVWLRELSLAVIYPRREIEGDFAAAAVIVKGDDGADHFIPYDGFASGAPIAFSVGPGGFFRVSVLGLGASMEAAELAAWRLDEAVSLHRQGGDGFGGDDGARALHRRGLTDVLMVGFGERTGTSEGDDAREITVNSLDYEVDGAVDYNDLLSAFLLDTRQAEDERFASFYVTAVPKLPKSSHDEGDAAGDGLHGPDEDGEVEVGPAVQLRPMHHYQFGLQVESIEVDISDEIDVAADELVDEGHGSPLGDAVLLSRHGGFTVRQVPSFTLFAGAARESVDFVLRNGFQLHWRRQLESWAPDGSGFEPLKNSARLHESFELAPMIERETLLQHDGAHYFRWAVDDAVIGDVVGLVFASESAAVDVAVSLPGGEALALSQSEMMFIFMGQEFVPLTPEVMGLVENQGVAGRLQAHVDAGCRQRRVANYLKIERSEAARGLFERDEALQKALTGLQREAVAASGPQGPALMVFRDHILRVDAAADMQGWLREPPRQSRRARLREVVKFENFTKAPALAHALVFNEPFRQRFFDKPMDPHSFRMPVLEYLMSKLYGDEVIDWAMKLKGESQAILWQLCLKRPKMVERLFELRLEPDLALNPFDETSLDHAEAALNDSSGIDALVIEKKVVPVFAALEDDAKVEELKDFAQALKFGAGGKSKGKALSLGELSLCLQAVERAERQWNEWRDEAQAIFGGLVQPLALEVPCFNEGDDFGLAADVPARQAQINNLIERLVRDLGSGDGDSKKASEALMIRALDFVRKIRSESLLGEIREKLDLALKYHHDLEIGAAKLYAAFDCSDAHLKQLLAIDASAWPDAAALPPAFVEPIIREQRAMAKRFERDVADFAESVHPRDALFLETLSGSLDELRRALPLLVWREAGQSLEMKRDLVLKRLKQALLQVSPGSAKLRRSAGLGRAVRQMIIAERMGPAGWPEISRSLERIEQDLKQANA